MTVIQKKICMLGAFAVGKTSLVARFVKSIFSDVYHTTVGVKIDKKTLTIDGREIRLILWDLAGEDEFVTTRMSYLRGADGYLLVVDGTRRETLQTAADLRSRVERSVGALPYVAVVNKRDLETEWELADGEVAGILGSAISVVHTSAKTGDGVEAAFEGLARAIVSQGR